MINIENIEKVYEMGKEKVFALNGVSLNIEKGEFISIIGRSGSGKSTLMNIIGLLDIATTGKYFLNGIEVKKMSDRKLAKIRNEEIGFVFQNFNLLGKLTVLENIKIPLMYKGIKQNIAKKIAYEKLELVGLKGKEKYYPNELSGGQQQRVAIARALTCNPNIILADEPTGALDTKTSMEIINLLEDLNKKGQTVILITHDIQVAKRAKRIIKITDGRLYEEGKINENISNY